EASYRLTFDRMAVYVKSGGVRSVYVVQRIGADDHHPIPDPGQHRHNRTPAEPPERSRHKNGHYFRPDARIKLLEEFRIHQDKEVEQSYPGNACREVDPAKHNLQAGRAPRQCDVRAMPHGEGVAIHSAESFLSVKLPDAHSAAGKSAILFFDRHGFKR